MIIKLTSSLNRYILKINAIKKRGLIMLDKKNDFNFGLTSFYYNEKDKKKFKIKSHKILIKRIHKNGFPELIRGNSQHNQ